ncbi:hypothetical protein Landi51_01444 [Colletotrichum acutatum]
MSKPRVRKDLATLNQDELDTLVRAFQHVISLKPDDKISYFTIAGHDLDGQGKDFSDGYTKPKGYETVRYPYSGLVSADFNTKTSDHNAEVNNLPPGKPTELLNGNITCWLNLKIFKNYKGEEAQRGLDTPLEPFTKEKITPGDTRPMISNDVTNTADLGYGYPRLRGHFILPSPGFRKGPKLTASEINRARSRGSFVISTWAKGKNGQPDKLLDTKSDDEASDTDVYALVHTRDNPEGIDTIEGNKIQAELATTQQDIRAEARDQVVKTHTWLRKAQAVVGSIKY